MAARDRWHQLAGAIGASNLAASDKSVFRYLLDRADYATAELPPKFTPKQASIAKQTSHSIRQVKYAIGHLRRHGWLRAEGRTGPGRTLAYTLALGAGCDCPGRVHPPERVQRVQPERPERVQPEPVTGATFGHRSGATNGCNAAGQTVRQTRGTEREGWGGWPEGTNGADANPQPPPRIPGVRGPVPADGQTRRALHVLADILGPVEVIEIKEAK